MMFFGPNAEVAAEKDLRIGRLEGGRVDHRHAPLVEFEPYVALDPGEGVLLADRHQHVVAFEMLVRLAGRLEPAAALVVEAHRHLLEDNAGEAAVCVGEFLGDEVVEDRDALVHRVLLLPGRRLHLLEAGADDHLHVLAAEAARGAAAVHRRIAAAEHDDAPADLLDVPERDVGQPVDADMNVGGGFLPAGYVEVAAARRAGAGEHRVVAFVEDGLEAPDMLAEAGLDPADADDVTDFLVDHQLGQTEARDLAPDHATAARLGVVQGDLIAEWREVARDGERGGAGADQGDPLAVAGGGRRGQSAADVVLVVGGDALEPADRDRLLFNATTPAGRLAGSVAGPAEDAREDIGLPVDEVGVAITAGGNKPDIFRHRRVRRASPLAVDDLVKIVGIAGIGRRHAVPRGSVARGAVSVPLADLFDNRHSIAS